MKKRDPQVEVEILGEPGPLQEDSEEEKGVHFKTFGGNKGIIGKPESLYEESEEDSDFKLTESEDEKEEEKVTTKPPEPGKENQYAIFIPRGAWGSKPEICPSSIPLNSPPVLNLVATWTDTNTCKTREECQQTVRQIQKDHIELLKLPDIRYHYLLGGDIGVYEGRGWHKGGEPFSATIGPHPELINKEYVEVAFIDKKLSDPTKSQLEVFSTIITLGIEEKWLTTKFRFYWRCDDRVMFFKVYDPATDSIMKLPAGTSTGS